MSGTAKGRVNTIGSSPSPQRAGLMAQAIMDVQSLGRSSVSPGGSSLMMTRPFAYQGNTSQSAGSPLVTGADTVESIEQDRPRLSSITADERANYSVGEDQERTMRDLTNQDARGQRHGSVASVLDDQRARELSVIKGAESRSLEDTNSETAMYRTESEPPAQQEEDAIGTDILEHIQSSTNCQCADKSSALLQLCKSTGRTQLGDIGRAMLLRARVRECCRGAAATIRTVNGQSLAYYTLVTDRVCFSHLRYIAGKMVEDFQKTGTVIVSVLDTILEDPELRQIMDRSFDMYDYHTRKIYGKDSLGSCRVMYCSLVQQLVRGDLEFWLLYAVLRRETNFISYPYYTKYTKKGDATAFRHVDCNLADAVADRRGLKNSPIITG
ncbi:hypothetical protein E8E11_002435 [Didymella keratinophila]|uniref:Uncharacterized protein n=1 Tax=Didymella heteroderae TaxID=1769908 RepID=A0A9P5BU46_9PLEO|nr:hypothetical protein E8E12_000452 [Didymella heteroderae]KAF3036737.1 hypothetical protein E8E11_002435 [Didymella keratinophila]